MRWARKPPGKRPEWVSLATRSPFRSDWDVIMQSDADGKLAEEEIFLNGAKSSQPANPWLLVSPLTQYIEAVARADTPPIKLLAVINAFRSQRSMSAFPDTMGVDIYSTSLLHVRLKVLGRGSPSDMAIIYTLSSQERDLWVHAYGSGADTSLSGDVSSWEDPVTSEIQHLGEIKADSKDTIGYATTGNFSLSRGKGHALASVTLKGYVRSLRMADMGPANARHLALVKVRNRDGRVCRLASVELV